MIVEIFFSLLSAIITFGKHRFHELREMDSNATFVLLNLQLAEEALRKTLEANYLARVGILYCCALFNYGHCVSLIY